MQSRYVPMSSAEFHALPFELGWHHEYRNGVAHFRPRDWPVITLLELKPQQAAAPCPLRTSQPTDAAALVPTYLAAFGPTIEYCDYTTEQLESSARKVLREHFAGERGNSLSASQVALHPHNPNELLGACLLTAGRDCARLDLLFVQPAWQNRQLATALAAAACEQLRLYGERQLLSRYHIGNEASRRWHQRFGFREVPDLRLAELHLQAARHELNRLEKAGLSATAEFTHWMTEQTRWLMEVRALKRLARTHGATAVTASYRW